MLGVVAYVENFIFNFIYFNINFEEVIKYSILYKNLSLFSDISLIKY